MELVAYASFHHNYCLKKNYNIIDVSLNKFILKPLPLFFRGIECIIDLKQAYIWELLFLSICWRFLHNQWNIWIISRQCRILSAKTSRDLQQSDLLPFCIYFLLLNLLTLSLPQVTKTEFLLTILIQYQAGRWWE